MKTTLIAATLALGFAFAAPAFAAEGRFGDNEVEAPNSSSLVQGSSQTTVQPDSTTIYGATGGIQRPIDNGQG